MSISGFLKNKIIKETLQYFIVFLSGTRVDTNTFTRPKKNKDRLRLIPAESCASNKDAESQSQALNRIPDVSDIQNMAKLQEESKRHLFFNSFFNYNLLVSAIILFLFF